MYTYRSSASSHLLTQSDCQSPKRRSACTLTLTQSINGSGAPGGCMPFFPLPAHTPASSPSFSCSATTLFLFLLPVVWATDRLQGHRWLLLLLLRRRYSFAAALSFPPSTPKRTLANNVCSGERYCILYDSVLAVVGTNGGGGEG